ncbi:hypothetical protein SLEP1_g3021 [Rubroshorea leprosula]|uniref:Ribosomal protein L2 n=1 Tax=Rubroshorea leprosula TaxID=152421 RepID=A0AAV5HPT8_9ROSI|nr:hypothetical protein SLEP1_g3021 [Rubroshorea leprosula]
MGGTPRNHEVPFTSLSMENTLKVSVENTNALRGGSYKVGADHQHRKVFPAGDHRNFPRIDAATNFHSSDLLYGKIPRKPKHYLQFLDLSTTMVRRGAMPRKGKHKGVAYVLI